nr:hypothetical protein DWCPWQHM_DWCPWQHM_CDS_0003 [Microvirus sp.]
MRVDYCLYALAHLRHNIILDYVMRTDTSPLAGGCSYFKVFKKC